MSFGYSRPHSTDSWRSRRQSFELSSRTSRENLAARMRPLSKEDIGSNHCHKVYDKELQRKMTFNLHEEIDKPFLTIFLEEICDPDRINDICLSTLTSMMRSKTYRKFLHHMNNNALSSSQHGDITHNSKMLKKPDQKSAKNVAAVGADGSSSEKAKPTDGPSKNFPNTKPTSAEKAKQGLKGLPLQFEEYRTQTLIDRKRRQDEINALEKLKGKLPPIKKSLRNAKNIPGAKEDDETKLEEEKAATSKATQFKINAITATPKEFTKDASKVVLDDTESTAKDKKHRSRLTAEETLKIEWLRLTEEQIADLEAEIIASGKDPGLHHFSKAKIEDVFR